MSHDSDSDSDSLVDKFSNASLAMKADDPTDEDASPSMEVDAPSEEKVQAAYRGAHADLDQRTHTPSLQSTRRKDVEESATYLAEATVAEALNVCADFNDQDRHAQILKLTTQHTSRKRFLNKKKSLGNRVDVARKTLVDAIADYVRLGREYRILVSIPWDVAMDKKAMFDDANEDIRTHKRVRLVEVSGSSIMGMVHSLAHVRVDHLKTLELDNSSGGVYTPKDLITMLQDYPQGYKHPDC